MLFLNMIEAAYASVRCTSTACRLWRMAMMGADFDGITPEDNSTCFVVACCAQVKSPGTSQQAGITATFSLSVFSWLPPPLGSSTTFLSLTVIVLARTHVRLTDPFCMRNSFIRFNTAGRNGRESYSSGDRLVNRRTPESDSPPA